MHIEKKSETPVCFDFFFSGVDKANQILNLGIHYIQGLNQHLSWLTRGL